MIMLRINRFAWSIKLGRSLSASTITAAESSNKETQAAIRNETKRLLESNPISHAHIVDHIQRNISTMNSFNIAALLHGIGKYRVNVDARHIRVICDNLIEKEWSQEQLGKLFYGIKNMKASEAQVLVAAGLRALTTNTMMLTLGPRTIGSILVGLSNMSSSDTSVRQILTILAHHINICDVKFSPDEIAVSMSGMRNKKPEHMEVGLVIQALSAKIEKQSDVFTGDQFSKCVNMMNHLTNESAEVIDMIGAWADVLESGRVGHLTPAQIGHCVMGLRRMDNSHTSMNTLLALLAMRLSACDSPELITGEIISNCLFGMQHMKVDTKATRSMHTTIAAAISKGSLKLTENDGEEFGRILFSLKNVFAQCEETVRLILAISDMLRASPVINLSSRTIGNGVFGLQNLHHNHRCTLELLGAVSDHLVRYQGTLDQDGVASVVFGLSNMVARRAVVKHFIMILTDIIDRSSLHGEPVSSKCVAQAYHGLRSLNNSNGEVEGLLRSLNGFFFPLSTRNTGTELVMHPRNMSTALFGLQSTVSTPESLQTLTIFADSIATSDQSPTHYQIASSLYGLQLMDMHSSEVQWLLASINKYWLQKMLSPNQARMSLDHLAMALYGVASLLCERKALSPVSSDGDDCGKAVPDTLVDTLRCLLAHVPSDIVQELPSKGLTSCCRSLLLLSHFTRLASTECSIANAVPVDVYETLQALVEQAPAVVRNSSGYRVGSNLSRFEKQFANEISKAFGKYKDVVDVIQKGILLRAFEADVVVTLKPGVGILPGTSAEDVCVSGRVIDIEIDGAYHKFPAKERFCHLRDRYLEEAKGIEVRRIDLESLGHMSNDRIREYAKEYAAELVASVSKLAV